MQIDFCFIATPDVYAYACIHEHLPRPQDEQNKQTNIQSAAAANRMADIALNIGKRSP